MKIALYSFVAILSSVTTMLAYGQSEHDNSGRPCYDVNVQIDQNNRSDVKQDCGMNYGRTAQAGKNNEATTNQRGDVNNNSTRQYEYNAPSRHSNR